MAKQKLHYRSGLFKLRAACLVALAAGIAGCTVSMSVGPGFITKAEREALEQAKKAEKETAKVINTNSVDFPDPGQEETIALESVNSKPVADATREKDRQSATGNAVVTGVSNSKNKPGTIEKSDVINTSTAVVAPPPKSEYLPATLMDSDRLDQKSPVMNVFGEFNKTRKPNTTLAADMAIKQHTFVESGFDGDVSLDPTGQMMVFCSARENESTQLYLQRFDSTGTVQLTNNVADDAQPSFSPDGKRIAFASNRSGKWHIYLMHADGRNPVQISDGETNDMHPSFSPDGTRLIYSSLPVKAAGAGEQWEMHVVDLVTRQHTAVGHGLFPAWSPSKDRDIISFQKTRARGSRWFSLWTCELKNGDSGDLESTNVTEVAVSTNAALLSPAWSPDGKRIAFTSILEPGEIKNGKPKGKQDIWVIDADGNNRKRLTDGGSVNLTPHWASDNRIYFVSDRSGHECIWSVPGGSPSADSDGKSPNVAQRNDEKPAKPQVGSNETVKVEKKPTIVNTVDSGTDPKSSNPAKKPVDNSTAANEPAEVNK